MTPSSQVIKPRAKAVPWPAMRFPPINLWNAPRLNSPAAASRSQQ